MESLERILESISSVVWQGPLLVLLFGTHVFLTVRLGFIQRFLGTAIRLSFSRRREGSGDISQFGALTTALAATIGTGNIVGVATAVAAGGPGAVAWMWLTGVFGIATKYAEAVLAVKYRVRAKDGSMSGGPMYVLENALGWKRLGVIFAALTAVAAFGIGCTVQANAIATLLEEDRGIPRIATGVAMMCLTAIVILGGVRSIARVCERLVPIMAVGYVLGCLVLILHHADRIPDSLSLIAGGALSGHAAMGGFLGAGLREVIRYGIARGLFSNESGLGSAPIVAAAAQTKNPVRQALVSATGTFWDTVIVCALTGLVIVNSGAWTRGLDGSRLTRAAFADLGSLGPILLSVALLTFVFSTILGWSYYGEKAVEYLFGARVITAYRWLWIGAVMAGSVMTLKIVWTFADIANAGMAVPNLIALVALSGVVSAETKKYLSRHRLDEAMDEDHAGRDERDLSPRA
ncbi:MAG: sodium:alanine symporter family protein [Vicinamibacteria bacterium]|nr:sodium:alanine symporter family protein [Vicinamibacteria bacterium]